MKPFLVLFEPEIAHNVGSIIRLCACFQAKLVIIRPTAFIWDSKYFKRSAMDYETYIEFYDSFEEFKQKHTGRIIGTSPKGEKNYSEIIYQENDAILLGKESTGLTDEILSETTFNIRIPIHNRSLNLSMSGAILLANALKKI